MRYFFLLIISFFSYFSVAYAGKISDFGNEMATHPDNAPIAIRGADLDGGVSRIVFDGIPTNGYTLKPANNRLHILFRNFTWNFMKEDFTNLSLLKNLKDFEMSMQNEDLILTIIYNCNCQADVYSWKDQKLVVDIFALDAIGNPTKTKAWKEKQADKLALKKRDAALEKFKQPEKAQTPPPAQEEATAKQPVKQDVQTANPTPKQKDDFQAKLQALLAAAGEQGVVKFKDTTKLPATNADKADEAKKAGEPKKPTEKTENKPIAKTDETKETPADDPLYYSQVAPKNEKPATEKIAPNVQVSQKNILTPEETEKLLPTEDVFVGTNARCLPDGAFKLPQNNPETETFYDDLTKYRGEVIGEFDKVDKEKALNLAYHYISYGLGEEAVNVIDNFGAPENRGGIAKSMAELLTSAPPSRNSMFATKKNCRDVNGLWSAYYFYKRGDEERAAKLTDVPDIGLALAKLPVVLQRQIGTALALNLVRKGAYKTADALMNQVAKISYQFDPSVLLVRGLIDAKNGFSDRAVGTLEDVMSKTTGGDQQLAGLSLSELKLAMGLPLTQRDMSTLEELVFLKSHEFVGSQALALIAENESRSGNFYKAFRRLAKNEFHQDGIKDPVAIKAEQLFRRLAISGEGINNPDNLRVYYEFPELVPNDPALHIGFAKKLAKLGHDKPAYDVLVDARMINPDYFAKHDQSYLMGKLLSRMGRYEEAVNELSQPYTDDKEYMTLKAEALNKIGQHQEAYNALAPFNDAKSSEDKARYALDAKEWGVAKKSYEAATRQENNPDYYYGAKASGYMSGYDYPGYALEYKKDVDVVYHQSEKQATGIEDVVKETNDLIELMKQRHEKLAPLLKPNEPTKKEG